jgi:hypothetical protein
MIRFEQIRPNKIPSPNFRYLARHCFAQIQDETGLSNDFSLATDDANYGHSKKKNIS